MDSTLKSIKDIILNKKCSKHPKLKDDQLNLNSKANQHRLCYLCIQEQKIPSNQFISISQLLDLDSSDYLPLYPFTSDIEFMQILNTNTELENFSIEIDSYFDQLLCNMKITIDKALSKERQRIQNMISLWKKQEIFINQSLSIEKLQQALLADNNSEELLHQFIVNHVSESQKCIEEIKSSYIELDIVLHRFSLGEPQQAQKMIISLVENLDLFCNNNINKFILEQSKKYQKNWQQNFLECSPSIYFQDSKLLEILNDGNQIFIKSNQDSQKQCYLTHKLIPSQKYSIKVELNNQSSSYYPRIYFGLVEEQSKNTKEMKFSTEIWYDEATGGSTNKIIAGKKLHSGESQQCAKKQLEFRIHLKEQIWRVVSLPEQKNITDLDNSQLIDPKKDYYFSISLNRPQQSVTILEVSEVFVF